MSKYNNLDFKFNSMEESLAIIGAQDRNLKLLEEYFNIKIVTRGETILVLDNIEPKVKKLLLEVLETFQEILKFENNIYERDVLYCLRMLESGRLDEVVSLYRNKMIVGKNANGKPIACKTFNQKKYIKAINNHDLVFGVGPAGTGKTFLAVVKGVTSLKNQEVKRIILTRPAVEAGESLGFLPGDLKEKVDPYLRPLYDSLHDTLGVENKESLIDKGIIEIDLLA